mmetsp:Transcript_6752/g.16519  ORF Transcript_6752/g.16519 Transcript_6752/m.16519 type:complete len:226 (+) Transcript_6752:584-1261(+)
MALDRFSTFCASFSKYLLCIILYKNMILQIIGLLPRTSEISSLQADRHPVGEVQRLKVHFQVWRALFHREARALQVVHCRHRRREVLRFGQLRKGLAVRAPIRMEKFAVHDLLHTERLRQRVHQVTDLAGGEGFTSRQEVGEDEGAAVAVLLRARHEELFEKLGGRKAHAHLDAVQLSSELATGRVGKNGRSGGDQSRHVDEFDVRNFVCQRGAHGLAQPLARGS